MFEIVRENSSRDRKFVPYREKLERQRERERERERERGYAVFLGEISRERIFCSR